MHISNQTTVRGLGLIFLLAGVGLLFFLGWQYVEGVSSRAWRQVHAVVIDSEVRVSSAKSSYTWVRYSYQYDGFGYSSENIGYLLSLSQSSLVTTGLKKDAKILVYVDPRSPDRAVLIRGPGTAGWLYGILGGGLTVFGIVLLLLVRVD